MIGGQYFVCTMTDCGVMHFCMLTIGERFHWVIFLTFKLILEKKQNWICCFLLDILLYFGREQHILVGTEDRIGPIHTTEKIPKSCFLSFSRGGSVR